MKGKIGDNVQFIRKNSKIILSFIVILLLIGIFAIKINLEKNKFNNSDDKNNIEIVSNDQTLLTNSDCMVDIKGAVKNPGVYTTDCSDNVSDIIRLAGGLTDDADTSVTNLAKQITNEMVIIIYTKEEVKNSNVVDTVIKVVEQECICPNIQNDGCINDKITDTIGGNKLININTATADELKSIPGIGEVKAKAIINYRNNNGKFKKIEDIENVDGISIKLYEEIKIYLTT